MNPIAMTAYYCCGARALDARSARPLCGDDLAERFMDDEARAYFAPFARFKNPNISNAVRHRIIDDLLRERLRADPACHVVILGAGFDTRAFRLSGGTWWELDNPETVGRKERVMPQAQAPNPLTRIPIDFAQDRLEDKLAPLRGSAPAVVVMEGVSMYLEPPQLAATLAALKRVLPAHLLVCDLMSAGFSTRFGGPMQRRLIELGARFATLRANPAAEFIEQGYRVESRQSVVARRTELEGAPRLVIRILKLLLPALVDGYQIVVFSAPG